MKKKEIYRIDKTAVAWALMTLEWRVRWCCNHRVWQWSLVLEVWRFGRQRLDARCISSGVGQLRGSCVVERSSSVHCLLCVFSVIWTKIMMYHFRRCIFFVFPLFSHFWFYDYDLLLIFIVVDWRLFFSILKKLPQIKLSGQVAYKVT